VYLLGLGVGLFATATSLIGLLWRIDLLSLLIAGLIAIAPVVFACRQFTFRSTVSPGMIAVVIALLPVLAWAAFLPPYSWDEMAYGAALPRDYARAGHFFYNNDYGPYSAFPGNYEALTTAALVLFHSAGAMKWLNLLLAIGLAAIAAHLCRALGAPKLCWPLAAALVLSAAGDPGVCADGQERRGQRVLPRPGNHGLRPLPGGRITAIARAGRRICWRCHRNQVLESAVRALPDRLRRHIRCARPLAGPEEMGRFCNFCA